MSRRIHWILTSLDGPTKVPVHRCLNLEVYSASIEYENEKAKPAHYLIQIVDCNDLNNQRREWVSELPTYLVTDPTVARAIEFFNIYHQSLALIEQGKTLIHCGNTTFAYDNEFKEYMNV